MGFGLLNKNYLVSMDPETLHMSILVDNVKIETILLACLENPKNIAVYHKVH